MNLLRRLRGIPKEEDETDERAKRIELKADLALARADRGRNELQARLRAVDAQVPRKAHR